MRLLFFRLFSVLFLSFLWSCAAAPVKEVYTKEAIEVPIGADSVPLALNKIVVKLRRGEIIGSQSGGLLCVGDIKVKWRGGRANISDEEFTEVFREELLKANYPVVGDPNALFEDPELSKAELLVAGMINGLNINSCLTNSGFGDFDTGKGGAYVKVNWQIYSLLDREVVYQTETEGSYTQTEVSEDHFYEVFTTAFARATQNLLADKGFHELIVRPKDFSEIQNFRPIKIVQPRKLESGFNEAYDRIQQSVVTVRTNSGHGSGFFIGQDGLIVTNYHVVQKGKFVKIILSTGREIVGEVLRTDKARDLALIGTGEKGRFGLHLYNKEINVGSEVYAAGSPLDENLQMSVSKGIISAYRMDRGVRLIQSDVTVAPGSSGGPLLDENGNVLGVTVSGRVIGGAPIGINQFINSGEIPKYLGLNIEGFIKPKFEEGLQNNKRDENQINPETEQERKIRELEEELERLKGDNRKQDKQQVKINFPKRKIPEIKESYPLELPRNSYKVKEGSVVIIFDVDVSGKVWNASIHKSSGDRMIDALALDSVKKSSYYPAREDGRAVEYKGMKKRFRFSF